MSYSQNNEESVILEAFGDRVGNFLDIGAYNGRTFSNTLRLAELGWSGVCVEPSPTAFVGLLSVHQQNAKITLVNAAISLNPGWMTFYDSGGDAVSSASRSHVQKWTVPNGPKFSPFDLMSVSVDQLFARYGVEFDMINLDVEGMNFELFMALPWADLAATKLICVEHDCHHVEMQQHAKNYGFEPLAWNGENLLIVRP